MTFELTPQQQEAVDCAWGGEPMVVEALAGTGKTATLVAIADALKDNSAARAGFSTGKAGLYTALNKKIVTEGEQRFPDHVQCKTVHSLAFNRFGRRMRHRFNANRMTQAQIGKRLGTTRLVVSIADAERKETKTFSEAQVAGMAVRMVQRFCQSADETLLPKHAPFIVGLDLPFSSKYRLQLGRWLMPIAEKVWQDARDPQGVLRYDHGWYLKEWQLSKPTIAADFILFDEAQDVSPVMADVMLRQQCQLVFVGDPNQGIYGFTGAVDAIQGLRDVRPDAQTFALTKSFRFGQAIADAANYQLTTLTDYRLEGAGGVGTVTPPDEYQSAGAVLCRTNAGCIKAALEETDRGGQPFVIGGTSTMQKFAEAAQELMDTGQTWHMELACFESWQQVLDYVRDDFLGHEISLAVGLIEQYGADVVASVRNRCKEGEASQVISTAHKAKGLEWPSVKIASDFEGTTESYHTAIDLGEEHDATEVRLMYVAATRAQRHLDVSAVADQFGMKTPDEDEENTNQKDDQ